MPKIAFVLKNWNKDIGQYHLGSSRGKPPPFTRGNACAEPLLLLLKQMQMF